MARFPSVAGAVVLYSPEPSVLDNIGSYLDQVEVLYAIDNSDRPDEAFVSALKGFSRTMYLPNGANLGMAAALNIAARRAIVDGYQWLLTMDQDSTATPGMLESMLACLAEPGVGRVGLISPFHVQVAGVPRAPQGGCVQVLNPMTSGSIVNLSAYAAVGPFLEELFIDQVDDEFCLRLRAAGYSVLESGDAKLLHRVGEVRHHRFPVPMHTTNHPPVRRYYITRNRLHVGRMYRERFPEYRSSALLECGKDMLKILLHEDQKRAKLRMMIRGYRDYRRGQLGPFRGPS